MKLRIFLKANLLILLLFSGLFAQQKATPKPLAFIAEYTFYEKGTGIKSLINAQNAAQTEEQEKLIVQPELDKIYESLKQIEIENNINILEIGKFYKSGQILFWDEKLNVTKQFISYFNNKTKNPNEVLKLKIPASKIASINTDFFLDNEKGIKKMLKLKSKYPGKSEICDKTQICMEVGKAMETFAKKEGYNYIFDSRLDLPTEISDYQVEDITQKFIAEFNKSNK